MPKLWSETIETHRRQVREAIIETTAALVAEHGLRGVTMSRIAEDSGIGRATLYKYFPDVETILVAWHDQHVTDHLDHLVSRRDHSGDAAEQLETVMEAYALICYEIAHPSHGADLTALVHGGGHVAQAQQHLNQFIRDMIAEGARDGQVRDDIPPDELAAYCLHALAAATTMTSKAAARRLATVTMAGLRR